MSSSSFRFNFGGSGVIVGVKVYKALVKYVMAKSHNSSAVQHDNHTATQSKPQIQILIRKHRHRPTSRVQNQLDSSTVAARAQRDLRITLEEISSEQQLWLRIHTSQPGCRRASLITRQTFKQMCHSSRRPHWVLSARNRNLSYRSQKRFLI